MNRRNGKSCQNSRQNGNRRNGNKSLTEPFCTIHQRKHYENTIKKKTDIFHISAQNIDCGYSLELPRRGGSNEYPQSMFLCRNKKNNVYPCKPQFYYIKVGFSVGVKII